MTHPRRRRQCDRHRSEQKRCSSVTCPSTGRHGRAFGRCQPPEKRWQGFRAFASFLPRPEHLRRHLAADLFLDTLQYNAAATASLALQTGLPVLTCPGDTFSSRVGATAAGQEQVPYAVRGDQVPGDEAAEGTGAAGDQNRPVAPPGRPHRHRTGQARDDSMLAAIEVAVQLVQARSGPDRPRRGDPPPAVGSQHRTL